MSSPLTRTTAMITPYIATASQKIIETKFLVLILGALTPPPMMETPVEKIPIAAPSTLKLIARDMPILHQKYGDIPID